MRSRTIGVVVAAALAALLASCAGGTSGHAHSAVPSSQPSSSQASSSSSGRASSSAGGQQSSWSVVCSWSGPASQLAADAADLSDLAGCPSPTATQKKSTAAGSGERSASVSSTVDNGRVTATVCTNGRCRTTHG